MNKFSLPKKIKLLTKKQFIFVFQKPTCIKSIGITLFSRSNNLGYPRIGLTISKKYIKLSHERNRIKRHMRETFRTNQHKLSSNDFILVINSKKIIYLKNHALIKELQKLWNRHFYSFKNT
ncbi:ribonuclease P protein component [Candidatus Blochmannia ocreatus (nom. nud.)]|uniref:Ribonuclease P protein component n=1 Tax=Candidatus Blochmannia ocreatus (nom. nud.) TaxID=251538 RepID=A0ABY4SVL6_9ENTR|nr:ribonuclease P protein component [Candidatus Blochmannia ocreatus]URJ25108.1 ribonuclease P protein component [Candidatus Blochmannia ocreatus]